MEDIQQLVTALEAQNDEDSRRALVQGVEKKVMALEDLGGFVQGELKQLLELDGRMTEVYREIGGDLWEVAVVLDTLQPCEATKSFLSLIIHKSNLQTLLSTWKSSTKALLTYSSPSPGFVAKIFEVEDKPLQLLDTVKAACSLCLARLITDLTATEVQVLVANDVEDYLALLCKEMDEAYKYLRSDSFPAVLTALANKVAAFSEDPHYLSGLKLATVLLGLLAESDALERHKSLISQVILGLGKDLHSLLITWRAWFVTIFKPTESSDVQNYSAKGIAMLAYLSIQDSSDGNLHLPCVFSSLYRLQIFVPLANLVFYTHPEVAFGLLDHAISHFSGQFRSIKSPFLLVPDNRQSTGQFVREMLELIGRTQEPALKSRTIQLFSLFLSFFSDAVSYMQNRYHLMAKVVHEHTSDLTLALVIDLHRQYAASAPLFQDPKRIADVVKTALKKKPAGDFARSFEASARLLEAHVKAFKTSTLQKIRAKYLETAHSKLTIALEADRSRAEIESALKALAAAVEACKEVALV
jgi:hypothetical protein